MDSNLNPLSSKNFLSTKMWTNWAQNVTFPGVVQHPSTVNEVVDAVRHVIATQDKSASGIFVVGSGHSFTFPAASARTSLTLLCLDKINHVTFDESTQTCTVGGGATFADVVQALEPYGRTVENTASLLCVTVAGAIGTATHGSGPTNRCLADLCVEMTVVSGDGYIHNITDSRLFVHLGMLGVVVALRLRTVPSFRLHQRCYEGVSLEAFYGASPSILLSHLSSSFWVDFSKGIVLAWLRDAPRRDNETEVTFEDTLLDGKLRFDPIPVGEAPGFDILATMLSQGGDVSYNILPFFRYDAILSRRDTLQTEWFVALNDVPEVLRALSRLPNIERVMSHGCEVRCVRSDEFAMSPFHTRFGSEIYGALHFTLDNTEGVQEAVTTIGGALNQWAAGPHWGKLAARHWLPCYQEDEATHVFWEATARLDPEGIFRKAVPP